MELLVIFAVLVLGAVQGAVGQTGFLSIDCGLDATAGYTDPNEGIDYVPDGLYVDAGENHRVAAGQETGRRRSDLTIRSFPSGMRNCYSLSTVAGTKYRDDPYDRFWWWQTGYDPTWKNISSKWTGAGLDTTYAVPLPVMQTAIEGASNDTVIKITRQVDKAQPSFYALLYFADFQNSQLRLFNVSINGRSLDNYVPPYQSTGSVANPVWYNAADGKITVTLAGTSASKLPPILNGFEMYTLLSHDNPRTHTQDFDTIMAIKHEYGIKKNWMGDPCFPAKPGWDGVRCSNASYNIMRILSLNLSGNQLNGPIPDGLCKNKNGSFIVSMDSNGNICIPPPPKKKNKTVILAISALIPVMAIGALVLVFFIWRHKRKPKVSSDQPPQEPELEIAARNIKGHGDVLQKVENRRFTYRELEKLTSKFQQFIGQGGFGLVYYGCLEDGTEVAVKMRSESSSHGLDEFFAEVQSLTKVHHRNLVSLVGYCREKDHLALVYEYMAGGSLYDHLRGNNHVGETLNWRTRVRIVVEAAQGLDYLHKGCSLPIIHRDVKTQNILLSQNLQAKIADFGLCKTFLSDTQTHISVTPAGSAGYMDPEYYHNGRLTESSDVYSFGVVLLEIVTGESPMLPGQGHIIQRVKKKIAAGNINLVADARLDGVYDVSSMWKVVDIALSCIADIGAERPTMATVVVQLKESLALEAARQDSGFRGSTSTVSDTTFSTTTFSPSAR
uniref:Protein kinase domain-containing protein n=1 Tax=Oryza brachyantha TaxID=4533 RepID=J3MWR7_ORYBR